MYYEINVSNENGHLFATAERSINSMRELKRMVELFTEKFPESEGYKLMVSEWNKTGKGLDVNKLLES